MVTSDKTCRTANGWDINGLGQMKDGRGNICPVTIILPTLAMIAKNTYDKNEADTLESYFLSILEGKIVEAKDMLIERFEWICSQDANSAKFMYENGVMAGYVPEEGIRSALKHGTLAMGNLGLAEALQILIGEDHTSARGMAFAKEIYQLFKDKCAKYKEQYKLNFGVYMTPAENLCYTAMNRFREKYGIIPKVSDKDYFTNSMHVPVWKEINPFEKIDIEAELTGYSSAGCITYVEMDSSTKNNIQVLEQLVNYAMDKDIPYFAINIPNDTCLDCGYTGEFDDVCPTCGSSNIQHLRRVTGYLTGDYKTAFNYGKQKETESRFRHGTLVKHFENTKLCYMPNDFVNSEGVSVSLWTVGCHFRCPGCQNSDLWDFETVQPNVDNIVAELFEALTANGVLRKLSILGGEPLCPENRKLVKEIIDRLKVKIPELQVYIWTGYTYDDLVSEHDVLLLELLKAVDTLIEGKFDISQRDTTLKMRGSKNQNILRLDNLQ